MLHCCSQCSFTAQFESALVMHHQLHHEVNDPATYPETHPHGKAMEKSKTIPRVKSPVSPFLTAKDSSFKLPLRTASATRLFGKLKAKICKSKILFPHPENCQESALSINNLAASSECTSKALHLESAASRSTALGCQEKETYTCHMCSFEADRITVLDRHLLNDHKIGLDKLLQLVLAKTKDGLSENTTPTSLGIKLPYYKPADEMIEEGEFIIETVAPKIKILKHAATNTEAVFVEEKKKETGAFEENWKALSTEIEDLMKNTKGAPNDEVLAKMKALNEYMCKFVDSSNVLKKVLDSKINVRDSHDASFSLALGDRDTPREWERAHSEKMDRSRNKYVDNSRGDKAKMSSESFYY